MKKNVSLMLALGALVMPTFHTLAVPPTSPGAVDEGLRAKLYVDCSGADPAVGDLIPEMTEFNFDPQGSTTKIGRYGDNGWDLAVKNGMSLDIMFKCIAPANNTVVAPIVVAGNAANTDAARCKWVAVMPDGAQYAGNGIVEFAKPLAPLRGAYEYSVKIVASGGITYQAPV